MTPNNPSKTFKATIVRDGSMCFIPVPFDPKEVFGKVRAPVKVTLNGYTYRSTIAAMGGFCIPLRKSNREAAGLEGGDAGAADCDCSEGDRLRGSRAQRRKVGRRPLSL